MAGTSQTNSGENLSYIRPKNPKPHNPSVTFENYHHYALIAHAEEDELSKTDIGDTTFLRLILPAKNTKGDVIHRSPTNGEKVLKEKRVGNCHNLEAGDRHEVIDDE